MPKPEVDLEYCKDFKKLLDKGYTYEMRVSGSQTNVGLGKSNITYFEVYDHEGNVVTDKYNFVLLNGDLELTRPQVLFVIESISKYYDGEPIIITKDNVKVFIPDGYTVSYNVKGKLEKIGTSKATIEDVVIYKDGVDITKDMWVRVIGGDLSINKMLIEITINSDIKKYDGKPLTNNGWRVSNGNLKDGHKLDVEINSSITDIGKIENRPTSIKITDKNGNNVKFAYDIHVIQGTLEVI